jgi:hypothetical protein
MISTLNGSVLFSAVNQSSQPLLLSTSTLLSVFIVQNTNNINNKKEILNTAQLKLP